MIMDEILKNAGDRGGCMKNDEYLLEGSVLKGLVVFAVPFLLAILLQAFYGAVDLWVVGKYATSAEVSAVATGSQAMNVITQAIVGLTTGSTVLIGQFFGAKKPDDISKTIGSAIKIFVIIAVVLTVCMVLLVDRVVVGMNAPAEAVSGTRDYMFICFCGIIFIVGYNVVSSFFRGFGDSKTPLLFVFIACIINIVVDICFVKGLGMGAAGAAYATVLAQAISFICSVIYLKKKGFPYEVAKGSIKFDKDKFRRIMRIGVPVAIQNGLVSLSFLFIMMIVNNQGVIASASVGVVEKIILFMFIPVIALSSSVSVMTAQNVGANRPERADKGLKYGILISFIFGALMCLLSWTNGEAITGIFGRADIAYTASLYLKSCSIDCMLVAFIFCMNGYFGGCGRSLFAMIHSLIATFGVRIPITVAVSRMTDVTLFHTGLAAPISSLASLIMCFVYIIVLKRNRGKEYEKIDDNYS